MGSLLPAGLGLDTPVEVPLALVVLTAKRWDVLKAMTGQGPLTIREVARRVGRDVKAVHGDVHALIDAGLLERTEAKRVAFGQRTVSRRSRILRTSSTQLSADLSSLQCVHSN